MISELRPGLQFHQYQLLEQVGVGGQGIVWSAEDFQRNDIVAIKFNEIAGSEEQQADDEMFARQLGKLLTVHHPNILPIYDCGLENNVRYLVSPYITGGSIYERLKKGPLSLDDSLRLSVEIASALDHLHGLGIIHRDITSSNVLLNSKGHAYLADFGLARIISNTTLPMHTGRGTALYSPPEQHKRLEITRKSDIYSFGILLFELFTGKLPWDGETVLGIQQLYSNTELPDPAELNESLPPLMKDVLRRITSQDPSLRPSSGAEVLKMLYYIFNIKSEPMLVDGSMTRARDADDLFRQSIDEWNMEDGRGEPGLTRFALINHDYKTRSEKELHGRAAKFMLFHSLLYGHNEDFWQTRVTDPDERLAISLALIERREEAVALRVLDHLDQEHRPLSEDESKAVVISLLGLADRAIGQSVSRRLLAGVQVLVPSAQTWGDSLLTPGLSSLLGEMSIEDSDVGDQAARVAGHLRSASAVDHIVRHVDADRLASTLLEVQKTAGQLPSFVPRDIRLKVFAEWIMRRVMTQPAQLFGAYMMALAGSALGIGFQIYLTYRLPEFMDIARISTSLEQGLIIGTIFSMGILITKVIVERFSAARVLPRIFLGTVTGALGMSMALFAFHVLFLNTPPRGIMIPLGCVMIALSYALSGLMRSRIARMAFTAGAILLTINAAWWLHVSLAGDVTEWTPFFRYDYSWSWQQVLFTSSIVAAWMGILGNSIKLQADDA